MTKKEILSELVHLREEVHSAMKSTSPAIANTLAKQYQLKLKEAYQTGLSLDELVNLRASEAEQEKSRRNKVADRKKRSSENERNLRAWRTVESVPFAEDVVQLVMNPKLPHAAEILKDGKAYLIDPAHSTIIVELPHVSKVEHASFSSDGRRLLTITADWKLYVWDTATGKQISEMMPEITKEIWEQFNIRSAALNHDGSKVLANIADGFRADLWDATTGKLLHTFKERGSHTLSEGTILSAEFSPNGNEILTGGSRISLWQSTGNYELIASKEISDVVSASFGQQGDKIFVIKHDTRYSVSDRSLSYEREFIADQAHPNEQFLSYRSQFAFAGKDGTVLTATDGHTAVLWDIATGNPVYRLPEQNGEIIQILMLENKNLIITLTDKHEVKMWNLKTGTLLNSFAGSPPKRIRKTMMDYPHASISADGDAIFVVLPGVGPGVGATLWRPQSQADDL